MPRLKSILLADGHASVAEMFAYVFARHDWTATRYSDGERAGEELRGNTHYDAALVSYRFDGIDGVELIGLIRALDHRKDMPIVMVTGTVDLDVVAAALAAGAADVLYQPTVVAVLVAAVNECLERRRHRR